MKLNEIANKKIAQDIEDLVASIKDGRFTKDGSHLTSTSTNFTNRGLYSLIGSPLIINGDFWCGENKLVTLKGGPQKVNGVFDCDNNNLTSLEGAPREVGNNFWSQANQITSLKGAPRKVEGSFSCYQNKLKSLVGCPEETGDHFYCGKNILTSLKDIHKCLKKMNGGFYAEKNPIESHILGLLKIPGCKKVLLDNVVVGKIINKYLPLGDLIDCQEELIEAGFPEYAQL